MKYINRFLFESGLPFPPPLYNDKAAWKIIDRMITGLISESGLGNSSSSGLNDCFFRGPPPVSNWEKEITTDDLNFRMM